LNGDHETHSTNGGFKCFSNLRGNQSLPIPNGEKLVWIVVGLEFTAILTSSYRVYLFGDFSYGSQSQFNVATGRLLPIAMESTCGDEKATRLVDHFMTQPCDMRTGEQFICVMDRNQEIWYAGMYDFGLGDDVDEEEMYQFHCLKFQHFLTNCGYENAIVSHFRVGGHHFCVCFDHHTIIGVDNRENPKFIQINWNCDRKYRVLDMTCSGANTGIITGRSITIWPATNN